MKSLIERTFVESSIRKMHLIGCKTRNGNLTIRPIRFKDKGISQKRARNELETKLFPWGQDGRVLVN